MPTITKGKSTTKTSKEITPKGAKNAKPDAPIKKAKPDAKPLAKGKVEPVKKVTKAEAKTPGKAKASTKVKKGYKPVTNSMRDFIYQALKRGGSARKIKSRAAAFAAKAGVEKYSTPEAYKGFDVAFFANMLVNDCGIKVDIADNKYKLA